MYLAKLCFAVSTTDIAATDARQLQQDRGEQVMSAVYILAMKVCQFHKDRVKQARCEFERVLSMNVRIVGYIFTYFPLSTVDIVALPVCQFQKDRDEQARCEFERAVSTNERIVGYIYNCFVFVCS